MDKPTLLEITQDILNDISGDEVNSIDDTVESSQVASIVKSTFFDMMSTRNWTHTRKLIRLQASGDSCRPTHMSLDPNVKELIVVNYDKARVTYSDVNCAYCYMPDFGRVSKRSMQEVKYINPEDFLRLSNNRNNMSQNITTVCDDPSNIILNIDNQNPPTYFTSFNDQVIVFDSWDSNIEDTMQEIKTQVFAYVMPSWVHLDSGVPDLPIEAFPQLIEEAKSRCALKLRQQADQKAEQASQSSKRWLARKDWTVAGGIKFNNYGRNRGGYGGPNHRDPTFRRDN